jgi:hypothetical protein
MNITDQTCYVIGNGESRRIFGNLERLKGLGTVYGCNAIYRDWPNLCDKIFAVSKEMYDEIIEAKNKKGFTAEIVGFKDISSWNYLVEGDPTHPMPDGLKIYRTWQGGDASKGTIRSLDFSQSRGSGCSAVLDAAELGFKHIFIIGFDILGAQQWEKDDGGMSRLQNNIYKNTSNYPNRYNMKAYLKYEWMYQLTQITRRFPDTQFYFINRREYITGNSYLPHYMNYSKKNFYGASYAELQKFLDNPTTSTVWRFNWLQTP